MRRTFAEYKRDVLHALGNPASDELDISAGEIVNDALEHLAAMHPWQWLSTGQQDLDTVQDQPYIVLPDDFGTLIALEHSDSWARQMIPTTWPELLKMRGDPIDSWNWSYWYVINTGNVDPAAPEAGLTAPRLELYPTPAGSEAAAIRIVYRRHLRRLVADSDVPQWPAYMDRPLSLLARDFASVDYDDNPESAYSRSFARVLRDAMNHDGLSRRSFGQMRGGLHPKTPAVSPLYPSTIPDPINLGN